MKTIIVLFALAAGVFGRHVEFDEDTAGNYNLKYDTDSATRNEKRSQDGTVYGSYSFVDPEGKTHTITYVAAENQGFIATGSSIPVDNNPAPVPVQETPEVLQSRAEHLTIFQRERSLHPHNFVEEKPVPVHEVLLRLTPPQIPTDHSDDLESQQAKATLLAAYREALDKLANEYRRF